MYRYGILYGSCIYRYKIKTTPKWRRPQNEDNLKMKTTSKMKMTSKWRQLQKWIRHQKRRRPQKWRQPQKLRQPQKWRLPQQWKWPQKNNLHPPLKRILPEIFFWWPLTSTATGQLMLNQKRNTRNYGMKVKVPLVHY